MNILSIKFADSTGSRFATSKNRNISFGQKSSTEVSNSLVKSEELSFGPVLRSNRVDSPIGNFYKLDEHFYRGAQPGIDENNGGAIIFSKLKDDLKFLRDKLNVNVVFNLRNSNDNCTNHIELEKQAIKELNEDARLTNMKNLTGKKIPQIVGINVPMYAENIVRSEQVEDLMQIFEKNSDKNIFVHCRSGNDRTGLVTALYRIWKQGSQAGAGFGDIRQEMIKCGHNQQWYPRLIPSLAACVRYMGITPEFENIRNANGEKNFFAHFYQRNRNVIKSLI